MKTTYEITTLAACLLLLAGASTLGTAQDGNRNYVMKTVHASASSTDTLARRQAIVYYDGLGRPVQTVQRKGAPDGHDLADRMEYDSLGREYRIWQAVSSFNSNGFPVDSVDFVLNALDFYSDTAPYKQTLYDSSPLDRIRKVTGPGAAWHTNGKGVTSGYLTNVGQIGDSVLRCAKYGFTLSGNTGISFFLNGLWPAGSLTVDRTEDEDGRTLWVFKDMRNLVVLERRLAEDAAGNNPAFYADTYYLYDDANRLVAVLPPELSKYFGNVNWSGSTDTDPKVGGFAYQYRYDTRGRMIAKKLPGAAWNYYIYDAGDRLVLTQDGNQRTRNEWSFRFQDALGRECLTGTLLGTYNVFSSPLALEHVLAVRDRSDGTYVNHGYTISGFTLPSSTEVLTVNWWDDYAFLDGEDGMSEIQYQYQAPSGDESYSERYAPSAQGLQTGRWSKILGEIPEEWEEDEPSVREVWYYDDHGRTVYHVKGYPSGKRMVECSGYDFVGNLTALGRTMYGKNGTSHSETIAYTYDNWGRPLETASTLDSGSIITLASNSYDAVGRLSSVTRGGTATQNAPSALTSAFSYNVRDWLTEIGGSLFMEKLTYETNRAGSTLPGQWGGNISSSTWKTSFAPSDSTWYDYRYDLLGRLTQAKQGRSSSPTDLYDRTYSYDLNGNMESRIRPDRAFINLNEERENRWTWLLPDGNRPVGWTQKLYKMTTIPPSHPWQSPQIVYELDPLGQMEEHFAYDAVGNRTAVLNAQGDTLSVTAYNQLNLPEEYVTAAGDTVKYVYSADGEKLFVKDLPTTGPSSGTEYAANYRIENGILTMIHTDAGYYTPVSAPNGGMGMSYEHIWYLKDHLGNNRVLADGNGNSIAVNDYAPFGESIPTASSSGVTPFPPGATESPYRYGGKEWNAITSSYDFEARQYSPSFHRFITIDPLAEKYYGVSPYAYCANDPVNCFDDTGRKIVFVNGYPRKWTGAPGEGGSLYWKPDSRFVDMAKSVFSDSKTYFPDIRYRNRFFSSVDKRRKDGYVFAKQNYKLITGDLSDGESVRFVTHSMGAAFAEGMADYLLEMGVRVDALIHFEPYQAAKIKTNGGRDEILTVDYQEQNDWVIKFINAGDIDGADYNPRAEHDSSRMSIHTYSICHSSSWEDIKDIITAFLNNE